MGNRLSELPMQSFVDDMLDVGDAPVQRVCNSRRCLSKPSVPTTAVANNVAPHASIYATDSACTNNAHTVAAEALMIERGEGKPLCYASAFVLKEWNVDRYLYAGTGNNNNELDCLHGSEIKTSSLLTFHGCHGDQINYRGDKRFRTVANGDCVTIYANVMVNSKLGSEGKYLAPVKISEAVDSNINGSDIKEKQQPSSISASQAAKRLYWRGDPSQVRAEPETFEFIVRRVNPRLRHNSSRARSFCNTLRKFQFPTVKCESLFGSNDGNQRAAARGKRSKTPQPRQQPNWVAETASSSRPCTTSMLQIRQQRRTASAATEQDNIVNTLSTTGESVSDHTDTDSTTTGKYASGASDINASAPNTSYTIATDASTSAKVVLDSDTLDNGALDFLLMGDTVTLECKSRPGYFLVTKPNGFTQLSANDITVFSLSVPELQHLVTLNQQTPRRTSPSPSRILHHAMLGRSKPELTEDDRAWLRLLKRVPLDIVYRILQYRGRWVTVARTVCRDWCRAAKLHVHRVRVNADFLQFDDPEEYAKMLGFVTSCRHLTMLTLRNMDELTDADMAEIAQCEYMRHLNLGGCRELTDACLPHILSMEMVQILNLSSTTITDAGMKQIAERAPKYKVLTLYNCRFITATGVAKVLELPSLESLNIRGCLIDKPTTDELQRRFPKTKLLCGSLDEDAIY